ncbi:MAG TPA: restriction endonuclease subunit S [Petrimonas sp.]|nr:restriction endonuclease subunit S [Petrimonas sp.]
MKIKDIFQISPKNNLDDNTDVSFIPMQLISGEFTNEHKSEIKKWKDVKKGFTHFQEGDVAIAKITPCFENRKSVILNNLENCFGAGTTELHILRPILEPSIANYTLCFVKSEYFINHGISQFSGAVGQQRVGRNIIEDTWFPLPPFSEQNRIVAEVERLFALIDIIEQSKFSIEQDVKQTKSKVIDLAIRGKLVPQDLNDEPASVLIEKTNKVEKSNKTTSYKSHYPFDIPSNWIWLNGSQCFNSMINKKPEGDYFRYIDIEAIDNKNHVIKEAKKIRVADAPSRASRLINEGDTLFSMVRPYLENIAYVDKQYDKCIASTGFYVCKPNKLLFPKYLYFLMQSKYVINGLNLFMKGDNSPSINNSNITSFLYPIPPISEQRRIVNKIEEIFQRTDKIQENLKANI